MIICEPFSFSHIFDFFSLINKYFLCNFSLLELQVITEALPDSVGAKLIGLVTSRAEIPELLKVKTK